MSDLSLSLGFLGLVLATAAVADAARRVAARAWSGDLLACTCGGLVGALSFIVLVMELAGTARALRPLLLLALAGTLWLASVLVVRKPPPTGFLAALREAGEAPRIGPVIAVALLPTVLLVALLVSCVAWSVAEPRPQFDAVAGHLPVAVQLFQAGTTWTLPYITPVSVQAQYPGNAELLALWLMLPVKGDFLVQLASIPGVMLAILGVTLTARALGARWPAASTTGLLVPTLPGVLGPLVGTNMQDMLTIGAVAAMAGFVARDGVKPGMANLFAAGLAGGIALGTRYGALEAVPAVLLVMLVQRARHRPRLRALITSALVCGAGIALTGAYFYIRNLVFTGDPLYPQSLPGHPVETLEKIVFPGLRSYLQLGLAPADWARAVAFDLRYYGPISILLLAALLAAPALAAWRRERSLRRWSWTLLPAFVFLAFLSQLGSAGALAPNGNIDPGLQALQLRYTLLALPLAAAVLAAELAAVRPRVEAAVSVLLLALALGATLTLSELPVPKRYLAAGLVATGLLIAGLWQAGRHRRAVAALGAAALVGAATLAPAVANHYDRARFTLPFENARVHLRDSDNVVAVAGFCEIYSLYGPDWSRRVEYLTGRDDQLARPLASTYDEWLQSLRTHGATALVVGYDLCFLNLGNPQAGWAAAHPEVFSRVFADGGTSVYYIDAQHPSYASTPQ